MELGIEGGFASPVLESQTVFRAVMDALANPGTAQDLVTPEGANVHLPVKLGSILLTLTDHDTPIWLSESLRSQPLKAFIGFHTGAPIVDEMGKAAFAFAAGAAELPPLESFNLGTQEYPDR